MRGGEGGGEEGREGEWVNVLCRYYMHYKCLSLCLSTEYNPLSVLWSHPHLLIELLCNALGPQQVKLFTLCGAVDVSHLYQHLHDAHPLLLALPVDGAAALDVLQGHVTVT